MKRVTDPLERIAALSVDLSAFLDTRHADRLEVSIALLGLAFAELVLLRRDAPTPDARDVVDVIVAWYANALTELGSSATVADLPPFVH